MLKIKNILLGMSLLFLFGCSQEKLQEYNRLEKIRVLALKADKPEATVGDTITITPLVSDFNGNGRTLTYSAESCSDPGIAAGADPNCNGASSYQSLGTGAVTGLSSPTYTGSVNTISFTIPSDVLNGKSVYEQANGVPYIFVYKITASDGAEIRTFKRIIVSIKSASLRNTNPTISNIYSNSDVLSSLPGSRVSLRAEYTSSSVESYTGVSSDGTVGTQTEKMITTWFVSEGSIQYYRTLDTETNSYEITFRPDKPVLIIAVLRDDRGGEDFMIKSL